MKKGILGIIFAVAGLQAQVGGGFGVGGGIGRGGAGIEIQKFQQAGTMAAVAGGRGITVLSRNSRETVVGRPVSGTEEQKSMQTLADGTEISTSQSDQFYRDSAGRTRVEMTEQGRIVIFDPVARVTVTLNAATKTFLRTSMPGGSEPRVGVAFTLPQATKSSASTYSTTIGDRTVTVTRDVEVAGGRAGRGGGENMQHEELGVQSLNGVLATGTRNTMTIPQGAIGNNRDIHVVNERWYSDDLQMLVKTVNSDPRFGQNTYEFTNISRAEPDPALFQIPPDYTVLDLGADRGVELKTLPAINK